MRIPYLVFSTVILFISNFIVRIFGFIYKIFLSRTLGETGLGVYHMVFNFLMICVSVTTTGIPTALSCLVANKRAIKDKHATNTLFISTLYVAFAISLIISLVVTFNSKFISLKLLNNSNLSLFILAIAPAIVIITVSNVLRGYYYGVKRIKVPAVGQIIEQITKILFVILVVLYIKRDSLNCYIALLGISIGELSNVIFMTIYLYRDNNISKQYTVNVSDFVKSTVDTVKMSIPITCNRMSAIILQSVSSMMVPSRLALSGITYTKALGMYGVISGMVMPFIFIPFTLGSALIVNLIPAISQEIALNKKSGVLKKIRYSIILTFSVGLLASVFFYFFGSQACVFIFKNELAGEYLKAMFLVPLFMSLNQTLSGILNSIREEVASSFNTILGMVIQLALLYFLLPVPNLNIYAFIYTLTFVSFFTCILHFIALFRGIKKHNIKI